MTYYYPQGAVQLRVVWEDFGSDAAVTKKAYAVTAIPKSMRVDVNSYTEADTFEIELDYKTFPFDPRTIKACQVDCHLQNMERTYKDGKPHKIVPSSDNAIFIGFADEDKMHFDDTSRTVTLSGRDYTGIFIDAKWPGTLLDLSKPLDKVIDSILAKLPAAGGTDGIKLDNRTNKSSLPVLASFYPDFNALSGKKNAQPHQTYWDVLQDICAKAALICYIELDKLVLTKPRTLYDPNKGVRFLYGRNVKELELTRKLGKQKGFNVRVRTIDDKKVLKVDIPREAKTLDIRGADVHIAKQGPGGAVLDPKDESTLAPFISFNVSNVRNRDQLIEIGEKIFEEIGRQQIEGRFTTYDMTAPEDKSALEQDCFDLLKLRVGTPLKIEIATDDLAMIRRESSSGQRVKYLMERCYPAEVAAIFAESLGKYSTPFYTKSASFTLDEQGFKIEIDFINFIETAGKGLGI